MSEDTIDNPLAVTVNDLFNDGATSRVITRIVTPPTHGTAVIDGLNIKYTPDPNYFGPDSLVYEIDDDYVDEEKDPPESQPSSATVNITVTNLNDAPTVGDDLTTVQEDSSNNIIDVLANDEPGPVGVGDESSVDALTIIGVGGFNSGGSATFTASTLRYTPATPTSLGPRRSRIRFGTTSV